MTSHLRTVPVTDLELAAGVDGDGRTVTVRVVSWNTPYRVTDDGRLFFREQFDIDGLTPAPVVVARAQHDPRVLPAGVRFKQGRPLTDRPGVEVSRQITFRSERDGLYADVHIDPGVDGDALLEAIERYRTEIAVSSEFDDDYVDVAPGDLVTRRRAVLTGIAFTFNPQHPDARVLAVREDITERPAMSDTPDTPVDPDPPAPTPPPVPNDDTHGAHRRSDVITAPRQAPVPGAPGPNRVSQFRTFAEFVQAAADGTIDIDLRDAHYRAIDVAGTGDMAGLIQVQWTQPIIDIYRAMTPTVQAFARGTLPDKGLTVSQPIVTARPTVAVHTPAAEIESTKATIGTASWTVQTAAGGQGTTIQAILRSDPSYLDALMRLYVEEMAKFVNLTVATGLYAAADDVNTVDLEYTDAAGFDDLIIDASAVFMDTIGRPAEVVGLSVDLWKALAKATLTGGEPIYPSINPMNRHGRMGARTTEGQIVEVDWYVDPAFGGVGDGVSGVVGVRDAYKTLLGDVGTMTADIPSTLVRDTAIFQFFAHGKVDATGLWQIANAS